MISAPKASTAFKIFLAVGMLVSGSLNTIVTNLANETSSKGIDGTTRKFAHPFVQALFMFFGELSCMIAFLALTWNAERRGKVYEKSDAPYSPGIFLLPAALDMTGTSLMYVGLIKTYPSVFQMLRGSVVIFTGILSVLFLKRKLHLFHWVGMGLLLTGLCLVGVASVLQQKEETEEDKTKNPILGDVLVICAQLVVAVQMVFEERFVGKYNVPALQAVGWEGFFGCGVCGLVLLIFYFVPGSSVGNRMENTPDAFVQMGNNWLILLCCLGTVCSISFFNYFGISVTKSMSATTRMVLDSLRTFIVWGVSLIVGWEKFQYLQIIGFSIQLLGTCVYNRLIPLPAFLLPKEEAEEPLLGYQPSMDTIPPNSNKYDYEDTDGY